jgi:phage-related protein
MLRSLVWMGSSKRDLRALPATVRFSEAVFVLHVFQKKSASGIRTPRPDTKLIAARLAAATRLAKELEK